LANAYGKVSGINTITYFDIAISLNPQFSCAYNNKALQHKSRKEWTLAVDAYLKCIEIEPNHWCYYDLWHCLDELKDYKRALQYAQIGFDIHTDNWSYHFALGVANSRLSNYSAAIDHYKEYLFHNPNSKAALSNLKGTESLYRQSILMDAVLDFEQNEFLASFEKFKNYINDGGEIAGQNLIKFYWAKLIHENSNIKIGQENPFRKRFTILKEGYKRKLSQNEAPTEDEENINKLTVYQRHFKVGFGNYEGFTVQQLLDIDPHYLVWCVVNLYHFCVCPSIFLHKNITVDLEYTTALEINTVKYELVSLWTNDIKDDERDCYYDDSGYEHEYPSYEEWLEEEFGEDAETAYWNLD